MSSPGELGQGVQVAEESVEVKQLIKEGWDKHAFNHYVCEKISLHRSIADGRDHEYDVIAESLKTELMIRNFYCF